MQQHQGRPCAWLLVGHRGMWNISFLLHAHTVSRENILHRPQAYLNRLCSSIRTRLAHGCQRLAIAAKVMAMCCGSGLGMNLISFRQPGGRCSSSRWGSCSMGFTATAAAVADGIVRCRMEGNLYSLTTACLTICWLCPGLNVGQKRASFALPQPPYNSTLWGNTVGKASDGGPRLPARHSRCKALPILLPSQLKAAT